jgi:hypothetical protein
MCISSELCTQHRNELDYSALDQTKHKLQQVGLRISRLYTMHLTERSAFFWHGVTTFMSTTADMLRIKLHANCFVECDAMKFGLVMLHQVQKLTS